MKLRGYFQLDTGNYEGLPTKLAHKRFSIYNKIPFILAVSCFGYFVVVMNRTGRSALNFENERSSMQLLSSAFLNYGELPDAYTCGKSLKPLQSEGVSPPLNWINPPEGVEEYVITMSSNSTNPPRYNWVYYNISKDITSIEANTSVGRNYAPINNKATDKFNEYGIDGVYQRNGYARPCSGGPGVKWGTFTLYAISDHMINIVPQRDYEANNITAEEYINYIQDYTLAFATINTWCIHYPLTFPAEH
jgi:phosphatidylethanolamine-binding protein (PEBP) family uncharacterized protein